MTDKRTNFTRINFKDHEMIIHGDGTIYWPEQKVLIVSDLHLEKGAALSSGAPLPAFDTIDTLQRLQRRVEALQPQTTILLGDSFHTTERAFRLPPDNLALLQKMGALTDFIWVTGNHDRHLPERLPGKATDEVTIQDIRFCHEADNLAGQYTVSGHYHPKARVKLRATTLSARCFVQDGINLIMPAFGSYTGGLNICHDAFAPFISQKSIIHLIHDNKAYSMPFQKSRFVKSI